jgi:hypothetical protein
VLEIDVPAHVPDVEIGAKSRRRAAKAYLDAPYVVRGIELEVADFSGVYALHEVVVFLL